MNTQTILGLLLVAANAAVAATLGDTTTQLPPLGHTLLVAVSAASGAVLLYLRPAVPAGSLVAAQAESKVVAEVDTKE